MKREDFKNDYDFLKALEDNADEMPTRLEKVLSKFHMCSAGYLKMMFVTYIDNEFKIDYTVISLNTVESLIKDLEVNE